MSYVELGNTAFRGELRGATGFFKGKLTAQAVNAVDTVNIAAGQITYSTIARYDQQAVAAGQVSLSTVIQVPDAIAFIEIQVFGHGAAFVYVDGGLRAPTSMGHPSSLMVPFSEMILLAGGPHTIQIVSGINGISAFGYIHTQYIRATGA